MSYAYHYRDLDSVSVYANRALTASGRYSDGKAEAYNNLAFERIARMEYSQAYALLDSVGMTTDNQLELLIADVLYMRLCQRESRNKDFYTYREQALRRMKRIGEEQDALTERMRMRFIYAKTEFAIVSSTYYYYVGLSRKSADALHDIDPTGEIQRDTAQYLNYLYQIGSGGMITDMSRQATAQREFEYLLKCYMLAKRSGMVYWQANALQAISEHLIDRRSGKQLIADNKPAINMLNEDHMPDSLVAGYLAQKALNLFSEYGDVYQTAGAYRTLSYCYWALGDYASTIICLENALSNDTAIWQAPDLVASVREFMSIAYSAVNDKTNSDINRNAYLDIQEETRQDRELEARAEQLERTSKQLNVLILFIVALIVIAVMLLFVLNRLRKRRNNEAYIERLLVPLKQWEEANARMTAVLDDRYEAANEELSLSRLRLERAKRKSMDNKAKVFLVTNVMPFIDRIVNEVNRLKGGNDTDEVRRGRVAYMREITDTINEYNDVLTNWIQLQQGELSLHIESFALKPLFDMLAKSEMSFRLKGISLEVEPTDAVVKADRVLTLFMLNTLADNARKFTPAGGRVRISAEQTDGYVEISVADTGKGLTEDELSHIFDHKIHNGHGFGLLNCKGIIDKYRKVSRIFGVCGLFAESEKGRGSRFFFRLPYGVARCIALLLTTFWAGFSVFADNTSTTNLAAKHLEKAGIYADSAYYSNINGTYAKTLAFADSALLYLNRHYKALHPGGKKLMVVAGEWHGTPSEIQWLRDNVKTDYGIILDIRNEIAVAALALHEWDVYSYNNKVYTRMFKELSADRGLEAYCLTMQDSSANKTIAVVLLLLLLAVIVSAYYFLYYRHVLYFRFCADNVEGINGVLLSDVSDDEKLAFIGLTDTSKYPEELQSVIKKIRNALQYSIEQAQNRNTDIELIEDERRKVVYETEQLHVCNNVIDNSLSTLKHETMYYPSRIRQLTDDAGNNIEAISEVAAYYKELYSVLCEQVERQAAAMTFECKPVAAAEFCDSDEYVSGDRTLLAYLFDILRKQCGFSRTDVSAMPDETGKYVVFTIRCTHLTLTEEQCRNLFSPSADNIPYLVCRRIVRENAEQTNLHACGITVVPDEKQGILIRITLARARKF